MADIESGSHKKSIQKWELIGILVIIIAGSLLHFIYEWTGEWRPIALIAAVNESTWEHLKLAFWPTLVYAGIEYIWLRKRTPNFLQTKTLAIYIMPVVIIIFFYGYTALFEDSVIIDILLFVVAVIAGQIAGWRLMVLKRLPRWSLILAIILFVIAIIAFSLLTFYPPNFTLFKDPVGGGYGIP